MDNPGILDLSGEQFSGGERGEVSTASCRQLLLDTDACGTGGAPFAGGSTEASGWCCKRLHGGWRPLRAATVWRPASIPRPLPCPAMDEAHGPTSFYISRTRAALSLPLDSHRHAGGGPCLVGTATEGGFLMGARLATPPSQLLRIPDKAEAFSVNSLASSPLPPSI